MNKLIVTYADGSKEHVSSDLTPEAYFDSRFGGLAKEIRDKCSAKLEKDPELKKVDSPKKK